MRRAAKTLLLCLLLTLLLGVRAQAMENNMIKVGIKYGNNALFSANLENNTGRGEGYTLGYFNDKREFVSLGASTGETAISVTVDGNVYIADGVAYKNAPESYTTAVGGWHLELERRFDTYTEAAEAASRYPGGFVCYLNGTYAVRVGQYITKSEAEEALTAWTGLDTAKVAAPGSTGVVVTVTKTNRILFFFDCGGEQHLGIQPQSISGEKTVTWFKGYRYNGAFEYQRVRGGNISVINVVGLEDYVKGVIGWELGNDKPLEALKAQAVCARTYAAYQTKHRSQGFDICTTTDCQVYQGVAASNDVTDAAVDETAGEYLFYNGKPVLDAVYYSCNGGASEDAKNVWGSDIGYLKGKLDPYEADIAPKLKNYYWNKTFTAGELGSKLSNRGYNIGTVTKVYVSEFTPTGNVLSLTFEGSSGSKTVQRETCRTLLGLGSMRFDVKGNGDSTAPTQPGGTYYYINGESGAVTSLDGLYTLSGSGETAPYSGDLPYIITSGGVSQLTGSKPASSGSATTSDRFVFSGSGSGHNVGLSQWGSVAMARRGLDYREILQFYYTDVTVEKP